jgi:hypothetical protein
MSHPIPRRLAAMLLLAAVLGAAFWPLHALVIADHRAGEPVFARLVAPGQTFSLGFMHSVEHCPVYDRLQVDTDYTMVVVETGFASSRTGLPYAAFGDEVFHREANGFRITNMHRSVAEIFQWVDERYDNTFQFNDSPQIRLSSLAGDTLLHIRIEKLSALAWGRLKARLYWHHRSK